MARPKQRSAQAKAATHAAVAKPERHWQAVALLGLAAIALVGLPVVSNELRLDLTSIVLGIAGSLAAISLLSARDRAWPDSRVTVAAVRFLVWLLVCSLASGRIWAALVGEPVNRIGWMTLVSLSSIALGGLLFSDEVRHALERYAWWIVLFEAVVAIGMFAFGPDSRIGGTLPNSTVLGEALALLLPWTLPRDNDTNVWIRRGRYGTVLLAVFALGIVRSRAALLVVGAWAIWVIAKQWKVAFRVKAAAAVALMAVAAAALVGFLPGSVFAPDGSLAFGSRFAKWEQSALAVLARPVVGYGPDGYWPAVAAIRTPEVAAASSSLLLGPAADDPHNFVVWIAVSGGLVGLALAIWLGVVLIRAWSRLRSERPAAAVWSLAGCLAIGLTAPLSMHILLLFALVLGASLAATGREKRGDGDGPAWHQRAGTVLLIVFALVSVVFALNAATRAQYEVADVARSPRNVAGAARASALWFADAQLAHLSSLHAGWTGQVDPARLAEMRQLDLAAARQAITRDLRNPFYALEYAMAVKFYGEPVAVVDSAFDAVFVRYPAYPRGRAEYALYLAEHGRVDEAREQLETIRRIDDPDPMREDTIKAAEAAIAAQGR